MSVTTTTGEKKNDSDPDIIVPTSNIQLWSIIRTLGEGNFHKIGFILLLIFK